ncbi:alpha/beta hydrolase family protein [Paradesertivirga mongoliensis]|uniref:Alpha/beta hydrolase family protein n=1 Tax=Paradesertivirga mongoliensis TaxID=2100740 RepID=A0ABW4ZNI0_9SPHI|nr:hypothetical protein [Pedobacter mongoliensis]
MTHSQPQQSGTSLSSIAIVQQQLVIRRFVSYIFQQERTRFKFGLTCLLLISLSLPSFAAKGKWLSKVTGTNISYKVTESSRPLKDYQGNYITVVYLQKLGFKKIGGNKRKTDVKYLLGQGYRVIELNYRHHAKAVSPAINYDIIAINDSIAAGSFARLHNCSRYRSYILFEGYRIMRDVPYFVDDPRIYNTPAEYTVGDTLHMDIIYPANTSHAVPLILSFSYSNSYASWDEEKKGLTAANRNQRLNLGNTLAGFNDSFLEGAAARGMAWAIADHPKYAPWGKGKPPGGPNDAYKSFQTNPDAARKVKSAVRTLRAMAGRLNLSGKIGIYGFSRGATAGSLAVGDRSVPELENSGFNIGVSDEVQAAALGPGVFDYTRIYEVTDDGDGNLETRSPWVWGPLKDNYERWEQMGAAYLAQSANTAPVLFFLNRDDEGYYQEQLKHFKAKLDSIGVRTELMLDYGKGHSVPQREGDLKRLYDFFRKNLAGLNRDKAG